MRQERKRRLAETMFYLEPGDPIAFDHPDSPEAFEVHWILPPNFKMGEPCTSKIKDLKKSMNFSRANFTNYLRSYYEILHFIQ